MTDLSNMTLDQAIQLQKAVTAWARATKQPRRGVQREFERLWAEGKPFPTLGAPTLTKTAPKASPAPSAAALRFSRPAPTLWEGHGID